MTVRESSSEHWDETEFRAVFLQHYARIVAILMRLLGDLSHAEEVTNDAFWRLYRQPALQVDGNVGGWLYRTATNLGSADRWTPCCVKRNAAECVLCWP